MLRLLSLREPGSGRMLGGFLDSLLQMFENCRAGVADERLREGGPAIEGYFVELYEKERPRMVETVRQQERHLDERAQQELIDRVDERIRRVVIPAYARLAARFTRRERNDFYLIPDPLHAVERLGWGIAGMALGTFAVWAPFIPIWEKEWILPFAIAGLFLPNLRRYFALRRYESELNAIVAHTDDEIWRLDMALMTERMRTDAEEPLARTLETPEPQAPTETTRARQRLRQGGR
jgi:hypothetical protein